MTTNEACELCEKQARTFCESDQARLCWDCDEKVHSANFLVAKHCRNLLCHVCSSATQWKAAGLNIGPAFSVCRSCAEEGTGRVVVSGGQVENVSLEGGPEQESESDDGEYYSDSEYLSDGEEEEDGENQVVPWSILDTKPPSETETSTYCSEDEASLRLTKRNRSHPVDSDHTSKSSIIHLQNEDGSCSSHNPDVKICFNKSEPVGSSSSSSSSFFRPLKLLKTITNMN